MDKIKSHIAARIASFTNEPSESIFRLLEKPKNNAHGDIALPCFIFAKKLSTPPQTFAADLKDKLSPDDIISELVQIGPFINFKINFATLASQIISESKNAKPHLSRNETLILDYSSPNIAKPFHVGHLRATLIGNCLDRLYTYLGYNVESINHLGDWGTQFGYVYAGCKMWGEPKEFTVKTLVDLYKKATAQKTEEEQSGKENETDSVTKIARDYFIRLEAKDPEATAFWKQCVDVSLVYLKNTYKRLDISFKHYLGESYYSDKLDAVAAELKSKDLLIESQGALGVDLGDELGFARILTLDGRSLYLTRDLAAAEYRFNRFNFINSLYVVGAPQSLHFKQLKEILKRAGKTYADKISHIAFGHVLGMKTRGDGQTIELNDFVDEAISRALHAYQTQVEKRPSDVDENVVSNKVALAAIIFSTLNRNNIKDVHFNWDDALSFQGDSGPYLLYAYARLCGIEEKAKQNNISTTEKCTYKSIDFESARNLLVKLLEFENTLIEATTQNEPLQLCTYALDLSKAISRAYVDLKVVGANSEDSSTRLSLFMAAKSILGNTIKMLGIDPIEKM